ncbi:hypothetical protein JQC92_04725 [Shewanella sp. 202IG2-18]|nr:hypothetical protein [Parashewanella hymeniacidonis]MBM7071347.1 hypothetical protein [Parashewanella hymeniacidonis]
MTKSESSTQKMVVKNDTKLMKNSVEGISKMKPATSSQQQSQSQKKDD